MAAPPAVVVFTRDLRVRDHPALRAAAAGDGPVVPLFVIDDAVLGAAHGCANRAGFLVESLADLDRSLQDRGAGLVVRRGDWVHEVAAVAKACGAGEVHVSEDVSGYARKRLDRLAGALDVEVHRHPGITVVPPEDVMSGEHEYKVFTPYFRKWKAAGWRAPVAAPRSLALPRGLERGSIPDAADLVRGERSPDVVPGGETEGLARLRRWAASSLARYDDHHDDLPGDDTSRISAYLHLGCLSPLEVASKLGDREGGGPFVRQVCWRDFYHQVLAARPDAAYRDYRPGNRSWHHDDEALEAWKAGRTGYPIVDAGMRQLQREGWMHNRARLVTASFLTKDLYLDWRAGAAHFMDWLVDGDLANNQMNWQWVAGTGNDTNAYRIFNPLRQAERFDPAGDYVRRYVDELADLDARSIHSPSSEQRAERDYPEPIVDHAEAAAAFRNRPR
jgi:deoxyribodipyrimidine photo-lyase